MLLGRIGLRSYWRLLALLLMLLVSSPLAQARRGEFGADLRSLEKFYTAPAPGESNFYFNMWGGESLHEFLRGQGMTNNHALIVLSHGRGYETKMGLRYAYYPDDKMWKGVGTPLFSARDIARLLGPANCASIHNVVIAGCNEESAFRTEEIRLLFVNATNVTHAPAGRSGYELIFRHGLIHPSEGIKVLYELSNDFTVGDFSNSSATAKKYSPYIAELFTPGSAKPFKTQTAGRELLDPGFQLAWAAPAPVVIPPALIPEPEIQIAKVEPIPAVSISAIAPRVTQESPRTLTIRSRPQLAIQPPASGIFAEVIGQVQWGLAQTVWTPTLVGLLFLILGAYSFYRGLVLRPAK